MEVAARRGFRTCERELWRGLVTRDGGVGRAVLSPRSRGIEKGQRTVLIEKGQHTVLDAAAHWGSRS